MSAGNRAPSSRSLVIYRMLASALLPSRYREPAGEEMVRVAEELIREARQKGAWSTAWTWLELHADLLVTVVAVWIRSLRAQDFGHDARVSVRRLVRSPGYSITVLAILTLGIGVNTAAFQSLNSVLFKPLPYAHADRLIAINPVFDPGRGPTSRVSPNMAAEVSGMAQTIDGLALMDDGAVALSVDGVAELVPSASASADFFDIVGVEAQLGRTFVPSDGMPGLDRVVVISDGLWARLFARDPGVLNRSIVVNSSPRQIVGVLPRGFEDPTPGQSGWADVWVPIALEPDEPLNYATWVLGIGRLAEGATVPDAQAELDVIARRMVEIDPDANPPELRILASGLMSRLWGDTRLGLAALLGAGGLVLLVACANLAGLVMARSADRAHEVSVRTALGGSRGRLAGELFSESLVLALLGGAGGVALAYALQSGVAKYLGGQIPRLANAPLDVRVLAFAFVASVGTALLFGGLPAWRAARSEPSGVLREAANQGGGGLVKRRVRDGLVVMQMAVSITLLVGVVMMTRSVGALLAVDTGFRSEGVLTFELRLPTAEYPNQTSVIGFQNQLLTRVAAMPGVSSAGAIDKRPLGSRWGCQHLIPSEMAEPERDQDWPCAELRVASPDYHASMGIEVVSGRGISLSDGIDSPPVALVNETLARTFWPGESAVGKRVWWRGDFLHAEAEPLSADSEPEGERAWRTVVGVIGDIKHVDLAGPAAPEVTMPHTQFPDRRMTFVVRSAGDPLSVLGLVRSAVAELDPNLPIRDAMTMEEVVRSHVADRRAATGLLGGLTLLAVVLSLAGVHGAMTFLVNRRTREIGVRVALGATAGEVFRMVVGRGARLAGIALAVGIPMAVGVGFLLEGVLYSVSPTDPVSLAVAGGAVVCTALLAAALPARRAVRVDPVVALRRE